MSFGHYGASPGAVEIAFDEGDVITPGPVYGPEYLGPDYESGRSTNTIIGTIVGGLVLLVLGGAVLSSSKKSFAGRRRR